MRPSNEPFWWAMFSAGGMILAFILPALVVTTGFLVPAEVVEFEQLDNLFGFWLIRLAVFGVAFFAFFHAAHRIRHTLKDLGLRSIAPPLTVVCYLGALAATIWAATVVI